MVRVRDPVEHAPLSRQYWYAFENFDQIKMDFLAKKIFKDLPPIASTIQTNVFTGEISAGSAVGDLTYTVTIRPTNGKKFLTILDVTYNFKQPMPVDKTIEKQIYDAATKAIESKLKKEVHPDIACSQYAYKTNKEDNRGGSLIIKCELNTKDARTIEEAAKLANELIKKTSENIDPEALFYRAWGQWRNEHIYRPEPPK